MEDEIIEDLQAARPAAEKFTSDNLIASGQYFTAENSSSFEHGRLTTHKTRPDAHLGLSSAESLVGTTLDNKIALEKIVGRGGMSVVYKGRHLRMNCPVAVKIIAPTFNLSDNAVLRLQQEARTAFALSHNHLAAIHDVAVTPGGQHYLVMEWVEGESLDAVIATSPMQASVTIDIFRQAAAGLYFAHRKKIIHRDIKPGNIMVRLRMDGFYDVKIVDFGIAKNIAENVDGAQNLTQTGEIFGTPLYMSPEQCQGIKADQRSDIYSLGCVMYEALTGVPPFHGENYMATIMAHLTQLPPPPAKILNVPPLLWSVVQRCLEKKPGDRYQSMAKLSADLLALENLGRLVDKAPPAARRLTLTRVITGGIAAMATIIASTVAFVAYHNRDLSTLSACDKILASDPNNARALLGRGKILVAKKQYLDAIEDITKSINLSGHSGLAYGERALAYIGAHKYHQAISDLNQALVLDPHLKSSYKLRAAANYHLGNWDEANADALTYLQFYPNHLPTMLLRARAFNYKHDFEQASVATERIKSIYPNDPEASLISAQTHNFQNLFGQADEEATRAIQLGQGASAYEARAYARFKLGKLVEAQGDVQKALALHPEHSEAKVILAQILAAQGQLAEALAQCNQVIEQHRTWYYVYKTRSGIYHLMGNDKAAVADSKMAEELGYKSLPANLPPIK